MGCAKNCCRGIAAIFYGVLILAGLGLIGLASAIAVDYHRQYDNYDIPGYALGLFCFGFYIVLTNSIGWCGSAYHKRFALLCYVIFAFVGILAQGTFVAILFYKPELLAKYLDDPKQPSTFLEHPTHVAGTAILIAIGFQLIAVIHVCCLRSMVTGTEKEDERYHRMEVDRETDALRQVAAEKAKIEFEQRARALVEKQNREEAKRNRKK